MNKEELISNITSSKKYKDIDINIIKRIVDEEIIKYKKDSDIIKGVKNRLHQIHGIYLNEKSNQKVYELLETKAYDEILMLHSSTKERLNIYNEFYTKIFNITGIPNSILDLACGYNPFSLKYMHLSDITYYGYDINIETNKLLNYFFNLENIKGYARVLDLNVEIPSEAVDVTFIFKFMPLLKKSEQLNLLNKLNTKYIVVSFPTRSISGKNVGMKENYSNNFKELIKGHFIIVGEIEFQNEILFIIRGE